uniref:Uncharacterized protein n=1 Tax=Anopheles atroparvus TaxID=41427 RepID=A0A182JH84_ANOAO
MTTNVEVKESKGRTAGLHPEWGRAEVVLDRSIVRCASSTATSARSLWLAIGRCYTGLLDLSIGKFGTNRLQVEPTARPSISVRSFRAAPASRWAKLEPKAHTCQSMGGKGKKKKGAKDSLGGAAGGGGPAGCGSGGAGGASGGGAAAKEKAEAEEGDEEDGEAKPKKGKGKKGKGKGGKSSKFQGDIFNEAAMENAYYICHNIQDVLKSRGFAWPEGQKKKKKGKK